MNAMIAPYVLKTVQNFTWPKGTNVSLRESGTSVVVEFPSQFAAFNFKIQLHNLGISRFYVCELTYGPLYMLDLYTEDAEQTTWIDDAGNPVDIASLQGADALKEIQVLFDALFSLFPFPTPPGRGHGKEHLLVSWLSNQPPEIGALIHALSQHDSVALEWDRYGRYPVAVVTTPEAFSVLSAMKIPKLQIVVRAA